MTRLRRRLRPRGDSGQLTLLVIGFTVILFALVAVVTNASKIFLAQRALSGAADGAAVAGASAVDEAAVYGARLDGSVPLTDRTVRAAVRTYVQTSGVSSPDRFEGFVVVAAGTDDGITATVTLRARVPLPFQGVLFGAWSNGYPVEVTARARSPLGG